MRRLLALPLLLAAPVEAQVVWGPPSPVVQPLDQRRFGHLPYADVGADALVRVPGDFAIGQPCRLQPAAARAVGDLLAAFTASGVPGSLHAVSCYRSITHQQSVFCRRGRDCADGERRAHLVAPPGYSEHETGYALDFAARPAAGCADTSDCIAETPAGRWLLANGSRFGFELSFPRGNAQGVSWEPWHWRWVGVDGEDADAAAARRLFAAARTRFPAFPAVPPLVVRVAVQPPVLVEPVPPPNAVPLTAPPGRYRRGSSDRTDANAVANGFPPGDYRTIEGRSRD